MNKKILLGLGTVLAVVAGIVAMSAYEAHVINVTAKIENALRVHQASIDFGTVFPQEYRARSLTIGTSDSFCAQDQTRVTAIDYQITQKPKPRPEFVERVGADNARKWCHDNYPIGVPYDPQNAAWIAYLDDCYYPLCAYLSKLPGPELPDTPKRFIETESISSFHEPWFAVVTGSIDKYADDSDSWTIDLSVPCFEGQCAQDWAHHGWELPADLESEVFGCDLWVEATNIYLWP